MKRFLLLLSIACMATVVEAAQITREQAQRRAQQFLSQRGISRSLKPVDTQFSRQRTRGQQTPDYYYVFNAGNNQGFVIVSGDDRTEAVLGYADHGSFDVDKVPCNMAACLQGYADEIKYIQEHDIQPATTRAARRSHAAIADLMTSKWNQDSPFNDNCPMWNGSQCVTGCSSTALAQIMYFHKYPASISTTIPGYTTESHGISMPSLEATTFDWGNMLDTYGASATDVQNEAVAHLFEYVATALQADFDPSGTSVWDNKLAPALTNYFGYGSSVQLVRRSSSIPDGEWDNLIYYELSNGRPVVYSGQSGESGHSFIVHGYDGNGKYAVNWGWGSAYDGYFLLNDMSPGGTGYGGGSGHYNTNQTALIGISPTNVETYIIQEDAVLTADDVYVGPSGADPYASSSTEYTGTRDASGDISCALSLTYYSNLANDYIFDLGYAVMQSGAIVGSVITFRSGISIKAGYKTRSYSYPNYFGSGLANGDYQIMLYSKEGSAEWKQCKDADDHILNMRVTDTQITLKVGAFSPDPDPDPTPEVTDADRTQLANTYAALKAAVETKQAVVASNEEDINSLKAYVTSTDQQLQALDAKMAAIGVKMDNDLLTAEQKAYYTEQLDALKQMKSSAATTLLAQVAKIEEISVANTALATQLSTLLESINTQASGVVSITTKEALDASKEVAAGLQTNVEGCQVASVTVDIEAVKVALAGIDVDEVNLSLAGLEEDIDAAIEEAQTPQVTDEQRQELAEAITKQKSEAEVKLAVVAENQKFIEELKSQKTPLETSLNTVDTAMKAIAESLKNDLLAAEVVDGYQKQLDTYLEQYTSLSKGLEEVFSALETLEKDNSKMQSDLDGAVKAAEVLAKAVDGVQSASALEEARNDVEKLKAQIAGYDAEALKAAAEKVKSDMDTHTADLEAETTALAKLQEEVDKAIAGGEEEYKRQQEEQLKVAKETCEMAVSDLTGTINKQTEYYDANVAQLARLKEKLTEIESRIKTFTEKAADIEAMIAELKSAASRTRATADEIANYQEALDALNEHISVLTGKADTLREQIATIEGQLEEIKKVIDEAIALRDQIQNGVADLTSIEEVEKLTQQARTESSDLNAEGTSYSNTIIENLNTVNDNINKVVEEVNKVNTEVEKVHSDVQEATGMSAVDLDESQIKGRYDLNGRQVDEHYKGVMIIQLNNGKAKTIMKR